jgi:methionyl-tRNA formyltransferase
VLEVTPEVLRVACGADALAITEVQRAGGRRMEIGAFQAGNPIKAGTCLA